jgi:CRP/FNR family transcriptional regulator, dissimilatory nitrate respiration regulator
MLDEIDMELISSLPLFERLPSGVLNRLLDQAMPRDYPKGHILFHRDDPAECFYIVLDGWVKVYRDTVNGDEAVIGVFTTGETLAEAAAFLDQGYPASGQVVENARVVPVFSGVIRREIFDKPEIAMNMLASMSKRMHHLMVEVEQLKTCSATQRVIDFLLRRCALEEGSAVIFLPYDKTLISRRLGMQPESLSRILSKLRKLGVRTEQNRVVISDVEALLDYCQIDRSSDQMVSNG